jgi:hypothetical protein
MAKAEEKSTEKRAQREPIERAFLAADLRHFYCLFSVIWSLLSG